MDPILGLVAADLVHNLRALLDNLIWIIASDALKRSKGLSFPLFETSTAFNEFSKTVLKGRMPQRQIAALKRHQPYKRRPEDPENDRLRLLHKMWNADKHHAPIGVLGWAVAAAAAARGDSPPEPPWGFYVGPLRKNNEVGWVSAEGAKRDLHPRVMLDVGFQTRRPTMSVPRHVLIKAYDIIANEVLPDFRQFLE